MKAFPVVEMQFHPVANLVEFLFCPSSLSNAKKLEAEKLALEITEKLDIVGLLAVEMFIAKDGSVLINEVAPRPHNSGHHTIEACSTSQYEMHLRAILDLPLGSTELIRPAVMVNLLGEPDYQGKVVYQKNVCLWMGCIRIYMVKRKPNLIGKWDM
jgi:5-(carboxyamino)imidazole ribonucleotide synthase